MQVFEGAVGDEEVREFGEGLGGEGVDVGVFGFDGVAIVFGGEDEFGGWSFGVDVGGEEAGVAGGGVFGADEEGLGGVDPSFFGAGLGAVGADADGAELEMLGAADALGEVGGGGAVGGDLPDVVVVVEEDVFVVFGPFAGAVGSGSAGSVFFFVPEFDGEFGGEVDGLAGGDGDGVPVFAVEGDEVVAVGGPAGGALMFFEEEGAGAGVGVDEVGVGDALAVVLDGAVLALVGAEGVAAGFVGDDFGEGLVG